MKDNTIKKQLGTPIHERFEPMTDEEIAEFDKLASELLKRLIADSKNISPTAFRVGMLTVTHCVRKDGTFDELSDEALAVGLKTHIRTIQRAKEQLGKLGYFKSEDI